MMFFYLSLIDNEDDRNWLGNVFETKRDWMLKVAYHYLKNEEDSRDAVQEIFCRMAQNIKSVPREKTVLKVYMETAIRNYCYTLFNKICNHPVFSLEEQFSVASDENLEDDTIDKVTSEDIFDYIGQMPVNYCSVLTLYFVCENKISEISSILDIPYKTVESTLYRGKKILKERFKDLQL